MRNRTAGQKARSQGRSLAVVLTVFVVVGIAMLGTIVLQDREPASGNPAPEPVLVAEMQVPEEPDLIEAIEEVPVVEEPAFLADSPFEHEAFDDIVGIGGGAGGRFGGRFGARRMAGGRGPTRGSRFAYPGTEDYAAVPEAAFRRAAEHPLSTFAVDVDTASYTNVRRFLQRGRLPPAEAVRVEELLNYFRYDYPPPRDGKPLAVHIEVASCPWRPEHRLVHVGVQARAVADADRKPANLVFLVDVSGSMRPENKLPLVKRGLELLLDGLDGDDRIAIVTYAQDACVVLDSTPASERQAILDVIDALGAGGSTNGGAGIDLAYDIATAHLLAGGNNRVILATDGDFNVRTTDRDALVALIEEKARSGVFLSVLGFGLGNLKDA
ncbi:MAG: von Willebrand factor type A domain-containing protein, partial [Planctomycetota bacterium]|nr:von Willebrand factor type A domain-containing protein [Planctomycetota bacterium]